MEKGRIELHGSIFTSLHFIAHPITFTHRYFYYKPLYWRKDVFSKKEAQVQNFKAQAQKTQQT